jgi:hypothetical protein
MMHGNTLLLLKAGTASSPFSCFPVFSVPVLRMQGGLGQAGAQITLTKQAHWSPQWAETRR